MSETLPGGGQGQNAPGTHVPVLVREAAEHIAPPRDGVVIDATVGHGGHARIFAEQLGPGGVLLGLDVDPACIEQARLTLSGLGCRVVLVRENFSQIRRVAYEHGLRAADVILADLGFCSAQLEDARRGLSFLQNQPLDMRLDDRLKVTAADLLNQKSEKELADLFFMLGEERASRRIARTIVEYRQSRPLTSTAELAALVCRSLNRPANQPGMRIHPATRVFQALRIAVNDELGCLEQLLTDAADLLRACGYIGVISFHSLEDRIVKEHFRAGKNEGLYEVLTKKPIEAAADEVRANPRARSAKLRIARKMFTEKGVSL